MRISEEIIRLATEETMTILGPRATPENVKKIVKEVVRRLAEASGSGSS